MFLMSCCFSSFCFKGVTSSYTIARGSVLSTPFCYLYNTNTIATELKDSLDGVAENLTSSTSTVAMKSLTSFSKSSFSHRLVYSNSLTFMLLSFLYFKVNYVIFSCSVTFCDLL